jgi:uncharacterized protein YyaL (SSP411 family)
MRFISVPNTTTTYFYETEMMMYNTHRICLKILERSRKKLFEVREKRPRPLLDDKIITAWNGIVISFK